MYSATARAIASPSNVLVPRPISSRMISDLLVAWFSIDAVSTISTMNVDCPRARSSCSPTRLKIRSTRPIDADSAGTKLPICAMSTSTATCLMYVDLPAMFGPVMMASWLSVQFNSVSLGTKSPASRTLSTTGWRPCRMTMASDSLSSGLT